MNETTFRRRNQKDSLGAAIALEEAGENGRSRGQNHILFDSISVGKGTGRHWAAIKEREMKTKTIAKHTPGPWKWDGHFCVGIKSFHDDGSERGIIAHVGRDGGEYGLGEAQANARLIAAGPDLLEAAKWGLKIAFASGMDDDDTAVKEISAAIAKAENGL